MSPNIVELRALDAVSQCAEARAELAAGRPVMLDDYGKEWTELNAIDFPKLEKMAAARTAANEQLEGLTMFHPDSGSNSDGTWALGELLKSLQKDKVQYFNAKPPNELHWLLPELQAMYGPTESTKVASGTRFDKDGPNELIAHGTTATVPYWGLWTILRSAWWWRKVGKAGMPDDGKAGLFCDMSTPMGVKWYLNGTGCRTPLHVDYDECFTIHKVLKGSKRFHLFEIAMGAGLVDCPDFVIPVFAHKAETVDWLAAMPPTATVYRADLKSGQTVIFPPCMFHEVTTYTPTISLTMRAYGSSRVRCYLRFAAHAIWHTNFLLAHLLTGGMKNLFGPPSRIVKLGLRVFFATWATWLNRWPLRSKAA